MGGGWVCHVKILIWPSAVLLTNRQIFQLSNYSSFLSTLNPITRKISKFIFTFISNNWY